jgi:hypothetical protein
LSARQGVGPGRVRRDSENGREGCDDSSGHQSGAAGPPCLLA